MQHLNELLPARGKRRRRAGFTLLELLIVMAVIAMLMGLLLAAIFRVNTGVRKQRARAAATALQTAIETYHSRYRQWPVPTEAELTAPQDYVYGHPDQPNRPNSRVAALLLDPARDGSERPLIDLKHFRTDNAGNLLDPWDDPYRIQMDLTYTGTLVDPDNPNRTYSRRIRVWSVNR